MSESVTYVCNCPDYSVVLAEISHQFNVIIDQVTLTDQLLAGVILFLGVIFGLLLVNGLWRRFK